MSGKLFVFEGPAHEKLAGWRHYQLINDHLACLSVYTSRPVVAKMNAEAMGHKFFAAGTWETGDPVPPGKFPLARPEIFLEFVAQKKPDISGQDRQAVFKTLTTKTA